MDEAPVVGRRERKKAATRKAIADAALRLFLDRGYDAVSIKDIADAADVATTTLFKHFPGKEALVFDEEADREAELVAVVRDRPAGQGVVEALRDYARASWRRVSTHPHYADFTALVDATPVLREYSGRMWTRYTATLGAAIADDAGVAPDDPACRALARFVLDIPELTRGGPDPAAAVDAIFDVLQHGWHVADRSPRGGPRRG